MGQVSVQSPLSVIVVVERPILQVSVNLGPLLVVLVVPHMVRGVVEVEAGDLGEVEVTAGIKLMVRTLRIVLLRGALSLYLQMLRCSNLLREVGAEVEVGPISVGALGSPSFCRLHMLN